MSAEFIGEMCLKRFYVATSTGNGCYTYGGIRNNQNCFSIKTATPNWIEKFRS